MKRSVLAVAILAVLQTVLAHSHGLRRHIGKRQDHGIDYDGISEIIIYVDQCGSTLSVETRTCTATQSVDVLPDTTSLFVPTYSAQKEQPAYPTSLTGPSYPAETYAVESPTAIPSKGSLYLEPSYPSETQPVQSSKSEDPIYQTSWTDLSYPAETEPVQSTIAISSKPSFYSPPSSTPSAAPTKADGTNKYGISYSSYNADSTCKAQAEVDSDFEKLTDYPLVRIYGVDCDQVKTVTTAAKRHNMTVFAGIFDLNNLDANLKTLIDSVKGDWSMIDTVSVGNELVNKGQNSPAQVVDAVNSARGTLRAAGYEGPVVIVDTSGALIQHPELCQASDYCAANCHAFFDPSVTAEQAGPYVKEQAERVSAAAAGKRTVITESGWPYAGQTNGAAVPSRENQQIAIESLKNSFPDGGIILFTAFDDKWKTDNRWTFSTERFWGFLS